MCLLPFASILSVHLKNSLSPGATGRDETGTEPTEQAFCDVAVATGGKAGVNLP